jgi:tRNA A37 N6-isopentenylltransferase MiaA
MGKSNGQKLYGASLYLNLGKFFALRNKGRRQTTWLRSMFNNILWKMVSDDDDEKTKISKQVDHY